MDIFKKNIFSKSLTASPHPLWSLHSLIASVYTFLDTRQKYFDKPKIFFLTWTSFRKMLFSQFHMNWISHRNKLVWTFGTTIFVMNHPNLPLDSPALWRNTFLLLISFQKWCTKCWEASKSVEQRLPYLWEL